MGAVSGSEMEGQVREISGQALQSIHATVVRDARRATLRWLEGRARAGERVPRERVRAYFWGIVRRRALAGDPRLGSYRRQCIALTLASDMAAAGHVADTVEAELVRALGVACVEEWTRSVA